MKRRIVLPGQGLRGCLRGKYPRGRERGEQTSLARTGVGELQGTDEVLKVIMGTSRSEQELPKETVDRTSTRPGNT